MTAAQAKLTRMRKVLLAATEPGTKANASFGFVESTPYRSFDA